ncbi:hypothetical protein [Ornithinimicrobium sp. CNJ-824]|uniref:hypothetical protein n=1 Tax=Ornithinimicrobium sp. CNJ-824 TaxID=1904966 RepID=UPI0011807D27|nr:hypothetical protein [Ornithinimicrobium sp. CNJ-824]
MRPYPAAPRRFLAATTAALVVLLTACGGDDDAGEAGVEEDQPVAAAETDPSDEEMDVEEVAAQQQTDEAAAGEAAEATRICDALTAVDPDTAFADLTFSPPEPGDGVTSCRMSLTNAEGEGLAAALDQNDLFSVYQEQYAEDEDLYRELDGLGEEAFILNNSQLHVRQGQERWMVSLQAIVFGDDPAVPDADATEAGLTEIARSLLSQ